MAVLFLLSEASTTAKVMKIRQKDTNGDTFPFAIRGNTYIESP